MLRILYQGTMHKLVMRMAVHGTLAPFDPDKEDWVKFADRLSYYFTANGITDGAKHVPFWISCCGHVTFHLSGPIR